MARIGNEHAEEAARLLTHYFALVGLDDSEPDYRAEIRFIVDEIVTAAVMAVQGFEPPPAPSREEIEHAIDRDSATFSGRSAGLIDEAERFAAKAREHPGNRSYGSWRAEEDLIEDGEAPVDDNVDGSRPMTAEERLAWQLNETLSALHEAHVEHHSDGEGNPPGPGECEICDVWRVGVALLRGQSGMVPE